MRFIKPILYLLFISNFSCQKLDCPEDLNSFTIRNSNYEYNCGISDMDIISKSDVNYICRELTRLQKINYVMTSYNNGYMSITYNSESMDFFPETVTLIFTVKNGYIFKKDGNIYKNDVLANHLIRLFEIKDVYSDKKCR